MQTNTYYRKPFPVQAVQVTPENLFEVASWCKGDVLVTQPRSAGPGNTGQKSYVKVPVVAPRNPKQTMAFPGDWVLAAGNSSFKVYTNKAFNDTFDSAASWAGDAEEQFGIVIREDDNYGAVIGSGKEKS
jgi:hypothetical protein